VELSITCKQGSAQKRAPHSALIADSTDLHCTVEIGKQERARPTLYLRSVYELYHLRAWPSFVTVVLLLAMKFIGSHPLAFVCIYKETGIRN